MKNKKMLIAMVMVTLLSVLLTGCGNKDNDVNIQNGSQEEQKKTEIKTVEAGDTLSTENYEIKLKKLSFKSKIEFKESKNYTKSVYIDSGKVALDLNGTFKNLMGDKIEEYDAIKCKAIIDDKYTYEGKFKAWQDLDPLAETPFELYVEVPESVSESYTKAELIFGFNDNFKTEYNEEIDDLDKVFSITITK